MDIAFAFVAASLSTAALTPASLSKPSRRSPCSPTDGLSTPRPGDFGKLLALYLVFIFLTAQAISWLAFNQLPSLAVPVGGLFIVTADIIIATASTQAHSGVGPGLANEDAPPAKTKRSLGWRGGASYPTVGAMKADYMVWKRVPRADLFRRLYSDPRVLLA